MADNVAGTGDGRGQAVSVVCPTCGTRSDISTGARCRVCSTDLSHPAVAMLVDTDAAIAQCQQAYDELSARWTQWNQHRAALILQLDATRAIPANMGDYAAEVRHTQPSADAVPPQPGVWGEAPTSEPATPPQPAAPRAVAAQPAPSAPPPPAPAAVDRRTPRRLTAPVLLGIAGASLLITAVIIFVAVTWTTFNPAAQGLLILVLAGAVGYGSLLLSRHKLEVSGGAVGVVSAAFAGVSVFAFDRGTGVLGTYVSAGALVVTAAAGYVLSRLKVRWVHSFAALATVGAGVAAVVAAVAADGGAGLPWVGVAGAIAGIAVGATHPWWRGNLAPRIVRYGAVSGVTAAGLGAIVIAFADLEYFADPQGRGVPLTEALGLVAPIVVLAVWHRWWPRSVSAPLGIVVPAGVGVLVGLTGTPWWLASIAGVLAAMALIWSAGGWSRAVRVPMVLGLIPAGIYLAGCAIASVGGAAVATMATLVGDSGIAFDGGPGAVAVAFGCSALAFRSWAAAASMRRGLEKAGAVLLVVGVWGLAGGASQWQGADGRVALSFALMIAAVAALATWWLWRARAARMVGAVSAVALGTTAGVLAVVELALAPEDGALGVTIAAAALPIVAFVFGAWRWPAYTMGSATALLTAVGLACATATGVTGGLVAVIPVAVGAVIAWGLNAADKTWRLPGWAGLIPAVVFGAFVVILHVFWAFGGAVFVLMEPVDAGESAWGVLVAALIAFAVVGLGHTQNPLSRAIEPIGAVSVLGGMVIATAWVRVALQEQWLASLATLGVALIAAATAVVWRTGRARATARIGAGVWLAGQVLVAIALVAWSDVPVIHSVVPAAIGVVLLGLVAKSWLPITYGPATLALGALVPAVVYALGGSTGAAAFSLAVVVAALVWVARAVARRFGSQVARPMAYGLLIPVGGLAAALTGTVGVVLLDYATTIFGGDVGGPRWWTVGIVGALGAGALAWGRVRRQWPWALFVVAFFAGGAVAPLAGAGVLVAVSGLLVVLVVTDAFGAARTRRVTQWVAMDASIAAIGWSAGDQWSVAATAAVAAAVAWWIVVTASQTTPVIPAHDARAHPDGSTLPGNAEGPVPALTVRDLAIAIAVALSTLAIGVGALSLGANHGIALVAATATAAGSVVVARLRGYESDAQLGIVLMSIVALVPPLFADTIEMAGVVVLVSSVAWWGYRLMGWRPGTWVAGATTSIGVALVLAGAGIGVAEAYFATPALCALAIGLWELRVNPATRTLSALGPALGLAIIPSCLAMVVEPGATVRVLVLVVVTLVLAVIGVAARWFAPVLGACVTAVIIALTQVLVTNNAGVRWVSFAVVGALLLVIAATFEKLKKLR